MLKRPILVLFLAVLSALGPSQALAEQSVLISGFDPFDGAGANYSEKMAKELVEKLQKKRPEIEFKFCALRTVYDKAADQLIDCARSLKYPPKFILSLGEDGCGGIQLETSPINLDRDNSADNDGIHRENEPIIPGAPPRSRINLPYHKAWCQLSDREKRFAKISNHPGSFVCNNTAYRMSYEYPETRFGFIHVPAHNCFFLGRRSKYKKSVQIIEKMALWLLDQDLESFGAYPSSKTEVLEALQSLGANAACEKDFYLRLLKKY